MADYHLHLIGVPELRTAAGQIVCFRTRKHFGLLVYLALEGNERGVPRDRLIELFWPSAPYERARHSLSQGLSAIRGSLGDDALNKGGHQVQLRCGIESDLDRPGAVADDGGIECPMPLDGLDNAGGPEFGHWLDRVRHRLITAVRRAVSSEIQDLRDAGDHHRVQERAGWLYRIDPRNETAVQLLAERSLAEGDSEGAARLLERFLHSNQADSNQFATATTLLRRIHSGVYSSTSTKRSHSQSTRREVFKGRNEELAALRSLWDTATAGHNLAALVEGPAGIGKSTLVKRFAAGVAARGHLVLSVSCHHVTREIPYAALSGLAEILSRDSSIGATDPRWLAEAARIAPSLRAKYPGIPDPTPIPVEQTRLVIAQAFREMLAVVADGAPTLIVIEDMHNLDPASRSILHMIGDRFSASPLTMIATLRTQHGRVVTSASDTTRDLFDWDLVLQLGPLDQRESLELIKELTASLVRDHNYDKVVDTIRTTTQGHPYYIAVFAADWLSRGPGSFSAQIVNEGALGKQWEPSKTMRSAFDRHYQGLSSTTRTLLQVIACAGKPLDIIELSNLTGMSSTALHDAAVSSISLGILSCCGDSVSFTNEAHRAFFYHAATPPSRSLWHARLARHLATTGSPKSPNGALEAAHHFLEAGMIHEATRFAMTGADAAIKQGAVIEVERLVRRLLEQEPTDWIDPSLLLAECLCVQGRYEDCLSILATTRDAVLDLSAVAHRSRLEAECFVRQLPENSRRALQSVTHAMETAKRAENPDHLNRCLLLTAELAAQTHDLNTIGSVQNAANQVAQSDQQGACSGTATVVEGLCLLARGRYSAGYVAFNRSVTTFRAFRSFTDLATALNGRGSCAAAMGELHAAIDDFEEAFQIVVSIGDNVSASKLAGNQAVQLVNLGLLEEARERLEVSKHFGAMSKLSRYSVLSLCNEADYLLVVGEIESAAAILGAARDQAEKMGSRTAEALVLAGLADVEMAHGHHDQAVVYTLQAEELLRGGTPGWPTAHGFDSEHMTRLTMFRKWKEGKLRKSDVALVNSTDAPIPLTVYVEISGLLEWLSGLGQCAFQLPIPFRQLIKATGLLGTSMRLSRVGLSPMNDAGPRITA